MPSQELVQLLFRQTVAVTKAAFNLPAEIKTRLWLLCVLRLLHLCLKLVSDDGVPHAEKSGLGCLHGGIQNKSVFENGAHPMFHCSCLYK